MKIVVAIKQVPVRDSQLRIDGNGRWIQDEDLSFEINEPDAYALEEALHDNTRSPVPDQVAFRFDFPAWLNTLSERDKRVVEDLMVGERTLDVARKHGLSPGRVSQLRREFMTGWRHFCGDQAAEGPAAWA